MWQKHAFTTLGPLHVITSIRQASMQSRCHVSQHGKVLSCSKRTRKLHITYTNNRISIVTAHAGPSKSDGGVTMPSSAPSVVTDQVVPEGHKSLHGFLYGEGGAERHESSSSYDFRQDEDDGSTKISVDSYLETRAGEKPLGVYALYDSSGNLQYVGYSRNIVLAIKGHLTRVGPQRCASCRVMVFANKAMATRSRLEEQAAAWLVEHGATPPGNGPERQLWEGGSPQASASASVSDDEISSTSLDTRLLSQAELAAYEEQRLKLRKAMGEDLLSGAEAETPEAAERRVRLMQAVEGDNWSAVIDQQTAATISPVPVVAAADVGAGGDGGGASSSGAVVSPFTQPGVHRKVGEKAPQAELAMTVKNVDEVLNEVRPYLMADGGDVEVVGVDGGRVLLRLQGACSTCASSAATLKMGIERALAASFKEQLVEVVQVDAGASGPPPATVENVDLHLNMLRGAVTNLGGAVEVKSAGSGVVVLGYRGPPAIGKGLVAAIKDQFRDVRDVVLQELEAAADGAAGEKQSGA